MGTISKAALRRLTLLNLISSFKDGVYGNFRLQKVLYFSEKESKIAPFGFRHTHLGQYSDEVRDYMEQLAYGGLVRVTPLPQSDEGNRYILAEPVNAAHYAELLELLAPGLRQHLLAWTEEIGYRKWPDLKEYAHSDLALKETQMGDWVLEENVSEEIKVDLSEEECEDIELSLHPEFIGAMNRMLSAIEESEFQFEKVERVGGIT